jgi:conjugal transfer ATP-binding protein TraC
VEGLVSVKDIIAPSALEVDFDFVRIDGKYYRTCFVVNYPRFVGLNWLSSLVNFDASLRVSMNIYPTDGKEILDDLRRKVAEMEAEISTDIQRGRIVNPATQAKLEDALNLQADLVKGQERFFQFGLYVTIEAPTKEELNRITKNLEASLGSLMIISKKATLQMEEGFLTTLPICSDKLNVTRNMDTTSLATTFPFVSSDLSDDKGIMYGINEHNGSLVIFDRFSMQNYNSVVFASAGAGKSYMIKLEAMRSLMFGTEIIVIDPENEYRVMAEAVGGQYIAFGYGEESKINPFDLSLTVEEGENALNDKILTLHKMFKIMLGNMDPMEESVLDRAVMEAYKAKGITPDPETQNKEAPLIEDLYKSLIGMEDPSAKNLAARLEKYIKGSFAGIFNQKTTVNLKNNFVVFGIRNLEETLRPVAMHIVLDYIWTIIKKTLKKRILIVDEAWYLMQYDDSAAFLRGIVKRGRKYYLGVTTITQDVDDFLETPYGKEIVTNSAIQILLKQHSAAIDKVGEVFYLSEGEKQLLLSADKGEGIFFAGQNHVAIQVIASAEEHKLITSNPEDILKQKAQNLNSKPNSNPSPPSGASPFDKGEIKTEPTPDLSLTNAVSPLPVIEEEPKQSTNPSPLDKLGVSPFDKGDNKVLFKTEVEGVENDLQKRIAEMEDLEKKELEEHKKKVEQEEIEKKKIEEQEKKEREKMMGGFGTLPKYQELFKAPKLPPLPSTPKPNEGKIGGSKPLFISQTKEPKIPQPPQLQKKSKPVFENPTPPDKTASDTTNGTKMDYDKLFGNDSGDKGGII